VSPKIFRNTFDGVFDKAGIYIDGRGTANYQTSPVISNNTIVGVFKGTGIYVLESTPVISNNTIINIGLEGTGNNGILCSGSASISDNVISGWAFNDGGGIGAVAPLPIYKNYYFIYPTIERNVITNNVRGLTLGSDVSQGGDNPYHFEIIQINTIANNSIGLYIWSAQFSINQTQLFRTIISKIILRATFTWENIQAMLMPLITGGEQLTRKQLTKQSTTIKTILI
jgi:hypothetical protein